MKDALSIDADGPIDVELYCRTTTATASAIERYHSRLDGLASRDVVDDVAVHSWPARVEFDSGTHGDIVDTYEAFAEWAEAAGVDLAPAFDRREYESAFTGERGTALVTPVACVAAYEDGDLTAVYPHTDGERTRTVEDGLDALAAMDAPSPTGEDTALTATLGRSDD